MIPVLEGEHAMGEIALLTEQVFAPDGPLAKHWGEFFRRRGGQVRMAREVARTFEEGGITVVEAGTGVGKSFAYLVPAFALLATNRTTRLVVATNKINLQHQLLEKDLPTLSKALDLHVAYCLLKGRSNYLSRRRLATAWRRSSQELFPEELEAFRLLSDWAQKTQIGDRAEFEAYLQGLIKKGNISEKMESRALTLWSEVQSDRYDCLRKRCPAVEKCFLYGAKSSAEASQIVVTNHHLLALDALLEEANEKSELLPAHDYLVIDEAHSLVESVTSCLTREVALKSFQRPVTRLLGRSVGGQGTGVLWEFLDALRSDWGCSKLAKVLDDALAEKLKRTYELVQHCFTRLEKYLTKTQEASLPMKIEIGYYTPLLPHAGKRPKWADNPDFVELQELVPIGEELERCFRSVEQIDFSPKPPLEDLACRFTAMLHLIIENLQTLRDFADLRNRKLSRWFLTSKDPDINEPGETTLVVAPIEVGEFIRPLLQKYKAVILTSATMSTAGNFSYILRDWGLGKSDEDESELTTLSVESPFDYQRNCILAIPKDLPTGDRQASADGEIDRSYVEAACVFLESLLDITAGRTLILFTSWAALNTFWDQLGPRLKNAGFTPLRQQAKGKKLVLTQQFKHAERAVLFATASFWEGIDIPGEQLSCVVIEKLPFPVPDTPLLKDRIKARGGNGFWDFQLPVMINRLRQGFGRLIRTETDRGAVVVLDARLAVARYAALVRESLPPARLICGSREKILRELREFFLISR
ncbi:MAG: DEAD/DEAH box helicase family protein [Candidatus Sumerlaeaceae bacterium]|nr:DEAD/DEAH box helicase family protein [Candidatus Sumerlaeaceae bacterium]